MSSTGPSSQPSRSLNQQVVLDEDEYTEALSTIIARDFFPSLVHLDATNDYLDALHTKDPQLINASVRRLEDLTTPMTHRSTYALQTPSRTPYAAGPSDTPLRTPLQTGDEPPSKRARYDTNMSLDNFQARYTSEDNSSFTQILDDENRKRRDKWGWAWDAQKRVEEQRGKMIEGRKRLLIEATAGTGVRERFAIEAPMTKGLITAGDSQGGGSGVVVGDSSPEEVEEGEGSTSKGKEVALRSEVVDEGEEVDVMAPKKDTRPAGVDGWNFKTRNALMFSPDADESPYHTSNVSEETKGPPKAIKHTNTRLFEQDDTPSLVSTPPSPTRSRIDAAIAGTPYRPKSPTINDFSLVPAVPSPTPSQLGPAAVKQLMTWGTLTATPRVLSSSDDIEESMPPPSTPFHIAAPSPRERLSHKLSSNAAKSLRAKAGLLGVPGIHTPSSIRGRSSARNGSMPPPSWTPRKTAAAGTLTPAARRLLDRTAMGTAASRRAEAMEKIAGWEGTSGRKAGRETDLNRVRWTPTPTPVTRRG